MIIIVIKSDVFSSITQCLKFQERFLFNEFERTLKQNVAFFSKMTKVLRNLSVLYKYSYFPLKMTCWVETFLSNEKVKCRKVNDVTSLYKIFNKLWKNSCILYISSSGISLHQTFLIPLGKLAAYIGIYIFFCINAIILQK